MFSVPKCVDCQDEIFKIAVFFFGFMFSDLKGH